jgi:calcium/calmodulin-dependent protein kinase I
MQSNTYCASLSFLYFQFDFFESRESFYLVFELATGGELFDRIAERGRFTERDAADIVFQILNGVSYLHSHGIVHRDLKPENILYKTKEENSEIVIADFGVANTIPDNQMLTTLCGSPAYAAPEVLKRKGHGPAADIWSIGVITFTVLMGYGPWYYCEDLPSMLDAVVHGRWKFESPYADHVSMEGEMRNAAIFPRSNL